MAAQTDPSRSEQPLETIEHAGVSLWQLVKAELTPYPGRAWVVARITIAATIVMMLVMTFRMPFGFLGALFPLLLNREDPGGTLRSGLRASASFAVAVTYTLVSISVSVSDPLTHFLWVVVSLFLALYLLSITIDHLSAACFAIMIAVSIPLWDENLLNVNNRVENTLWLALIVLVGSGVTIAVEYVFHQVRPITQLAEAIDTRMKEVEEVLRRLGGELPLGGDLEKQILLYSTVGTSRLRPLLAHSQFSPEFTGQMNAAISLVGHLVDLASSLCAVRATQITSLAESDRQRCMELAAQIDGLRRDLYTHQPPSPITLPEGQPSELPFLRTMESATALIPKAFSGSAALDEISPAPMNAGGRQRLFATDAFTSPGHLQFAVRGSLAAMLSYVIYNAVAWPGLSSSISTCAITALSTIGGSRQKQFLRLSGAMIGGFIFGMGAQIFILPQLDSITGFTLLFVAVTAIAAWICTATPRISYLGVQLALAFYLINLGEFRIQTSLGVARDRVFGVLLGLLCMWLTYDRLWAKDALQEMHSQFSRNLEMMAELADQLATIGEGPVEHLRELRDRINSGFQTVVSQSDALVFEFAASRQMKMKRRGDIRRWQTAFRTLLQVQLTSLQYRPQNLTRRFPAILIEAYMVFQKDVASVMRAIADEITGAAPSPVPDLKVSAAKLRQQIHNYYDKEQLPASALGVDIISLTETLAYILGPLYQDICANSGAAEKKSFEGNRVNPSLER